MNTIDPKKTLYLIDGSSFLYRAYYGVRPLHTPEGEAVQAVYAFCRMIHKLIKKFSPEHIAIVWDSKGKTTRHELYAEYKATRQAPPSDLFTQKEHIIEFADALGIAQLSQTGIEADDLLYSLAREWSEQGGTSIIITTDKDMGQALSDSVLMYDAFKEILYTVPMFEEKMGFPVSKLPFYFALLGDASDNIPGVRGIGKKGALELVTAFDSVGHLYSNIDAVSSKRLRTALSDQKENAELSEKLFLLQYHPTHIHLNELIFNPADWYKAFPLFKKLSFKSLIDESESPRKINAAPSDKIEHLKTHDFQLIHTVEQLEQLAQDMKHWKACAVDTETDGKAPLESALIGLSLCADGQRAYYVACGHINAPQDIKVDDVRRLIGPWFADVQLKKYLHNAKFDQLVLAAHDIPLRGVSFDSMIAADLLTEDWQKIGLKSLAEHYLHEAMLTFKEVVQEKGYENFSHVPLEDALLYAANDALQTYRLTQLFEKQLAAQPTLEALFYDLEMPISQLLFEMEYAGILCDKTVLETLDVHISAELERLIKEIREQLPEKQEEFNFNSPKQMQYILFEMLQLPPQKKSAKGTGYSTDREVLLQLSKLHPVPALILKYRELFKLKSTYIDALPTFINPNTGRIHTTYSQTIVATGRLSSSDPNLQNIPAEGSEYGKGIRAAFIPQEGHVFISADYSQIELRVLAQLSQDRNLKEAFLNGNDIHKETAARLFDVRLDDVSHEQRQIGKRINFSILYGLTPYGLSKDLDISFKDAKHYIDVYFAQYPGVSHWMETVLSQTKELGYVTTLGGRKRHIPAIYEKNKTLYEEACRIAINTKAQGTAAEIMKKGMLQVAAAFKKNQWDAFIVLQIHDEILVSVEAARANEIQALIKAQMEGVVKWEIPLVVTTRIGKNWQEVSK